MGKERAYNKQRQSKQINEEGRSLSEMNGILEYTIARIRACLKMRFAVFGLCECKLIFMLRAAADSF